MTITQEGIFRHGTFGFPVHIRLAEAAIDLSGAGSLPVPTSLALDVKRPGEDTFEIAAVPTIYTDTLGILEWLPADGDLTVKGVYHVIVTVQFSPTMALTVEGTMRVS